MVPFYSFYINHETVHYSGNILSQLNFRKNQFTYFPEEGATLQALGPAYYVGQSYLENEKIKV